MSEARLWLEQVIWLVQGQISAGRQSLTLRERLTPRADAVSEN
ncbi:hypothetical protein [Citrobacter koseri]|nr:hypothetical protein [Citrobacter koseri]